MPVDFLPEERSFGSPRIRSTSDPAEFGTYAHRRQSRDAYGRQEFESAEEQMRAFVGAAVGVRNNPRVP